MADSRLGSIQNEPGASYSDTKLKNKTMGHVKGTQEPAWGGKKLSIATTKTI